MSVLFRSAPQESRGVRLPSDLVARLTDSVGYGVFVDRDSAMRHDAVWACVTRISQDVSMMPVDVVRYVGGVRQAVDPAPQIVAAPSVFISALDWRYQLVESWLTAGNAWGLVTATSDHGAYPTRIELLSPSQVRWSPGPDGVSFFVDNTPEELWPLGRLWHSAAYTLPGQRLGMSPISYHAASIGLGLTAQKFGGDYLAAGGPTALIQPEGSLTDEQAKSLKRRFLELASGRREPIVLPSTTKYTPLTVSPEDSQFLDAMRYSAEQIIGRVFLEDPADYGASAGGSSLTYANRSDADLARFKRRQFWVTKVQEVLSAMLPPTVVVKLNTSAALMMTARERHEVHKLRLDSRTLTVNEVRKVEDESPFDAAFDEPGIPGDTTIGGAV